MEAKEPIPEGIYYCLAEDCFACLEWNIEYLLTDQEVFYNTWIDRKNEFPLYKITRKEILGEIKR